jgi:SAM-dependent methyltransferase
VAVIEDRTRWDTRYLEGMTPWDTGITPPEVVEFWRDAASTDRMTALDLGCGSGTNARFLAARGATVIALDHSGIALEMARQRTARQYPVHISKISFAQADVACLPLCGALASYILDIGCLHALPSDARNNYVHGVLENLAPGGYYHLFAFDRTTDEAATPDRGMGRNEVADLFVPPLELVDVRRGTPDQNPCRWYLLKRPH